MYVLQTSIPIIFCFFSQHWSYILEIHELEIEVLRQKIEREKEERVTAKLKKAIWHKKYKDSFGMSPPRELLEVVMSNELCSIFNIDKSFFLLVILKYFN